MKQLDLVEMVNTQMEIIKKEASIIDGLFSLLSQHLSAWELCSLPELAEMEDVARIYKDLSKEEIKQ